MDDINSSGPSHRQVTGSILSVIGEILGHYSLAPPHRLDTRKGVDLSLGWDYILCIILLLPLRSVLWRSQGEVKSAEVTLPSQIVCASAQAR